MTLEKILKRTNENFNGAKWDVINPFFPPRGRTIIPRGANARPPNPLPFYDLEKKIRHDIHDIDFFLENIYELLNVGTRISRPRKKCIDF